MSSTLIGQTRTYTFNDGTLRAGLRIEQPTQELVRNSLGLVNASPEDAVRYGGDLTREALSAMNLRNDRMYVVVDVKVHMLMPGMCPAIPGWHTDGAPRGGWTGGSTHAGHFDPQGSGPPQLALQERHIRPPRYHLLTTGTGCNTEFLTNRFVDLEVEDGSPSLYGSITRAVEQELEAGRLEKFSTDSCRVYEWDWWELHQGTIAREREWRYLIRVTETDYLAPDTDLRRVIRTQQQVYAPLTFGW